MASAPDTDVTEDEDLEQEEVEQGTVVFVNDGGDTDNDLWDDTALIKAYDKAVQKVHQSNKDLKPPKSKKKKNKGKKSGEKSSWKWLVGNRCRAVYSEDGYTYDAVITQMLADGKCMVQYAEYGNEEEQDIINLLRPQKPTRQRTGSVHSIHSDAGCSDCSSTQNTWRPTSHHQHTTGGAYADMPSFIPPPPPSLPALPACSEDEAFHSMLISWYMSGYHTGYYQGLKDGKAPS